MDPGLGSNNDSERQVLDVMFSFVTDLTNNFDAFLTSKVKSSFTKSLLRGCLELLPRQEFIPGARYITSNSLLHWCIGAAIIDFLTVQHGRQRKVVATRFCRKKSVDVFTK